MVFGSLVRLSVSFAVIAFIALEPAAGAAKRAAGSAKRIAVLSPTGAEKKDAPVRAKLVRTLKQNKIHVVTGKRVQKTIEKDGAPSSDADWVKLARTLKVDGFVASTLSKEGTRRTLDVVIRNGADGSSAGQETFVAKGKPARLASVVTASFWKKLGPAVKQTAAPQKEDQFATLMGIPASTPSSPPSAATSPTEPPPKVEAMATPPSSTAPLKTAPASEPESSGSSASARVQATNQAKDEGTEGNVITASPESPMSAADGLSTYEVEADLRTLRRTFDYSPNAAAQHYFLNFNPVAGGRASWYPLRNLGVFVQGEFGAGLETGSYPTGTREILGGARFRYPFSFGQLGASASYFNHAFLIQDTTSTSDPSRLTLSIPNTVYSGARLAANARVRISSRVHVQLDAAYRLVTSLGDGLGQVKSRQYFPNADRPTGLDASAFVGVGVGSVFEVRGGVDYRRYSFGTLQGTTLGGAAINASGAVDQYFAISLGVAAVLGGK